MMMRRLVVVAGLAAVAIAVSVAPACADDLSDYLADADEAIYSGKRFVGTTWDGIVSAGIVEVQHHGGMATVGSGSAYATVGDGRWFRGDPDEDGFSFVRRSIPDSTGRYTIAHGDPAEHLGRSAHVLDILENGELRMRVIVDDSTSAPVVTEVYAPDGSVFRSSSMVEFSVSADADMVAGGDREYRMMVPLDEIDFPAEAAGYELIDAYAAPESALQAFYTDGLFSFSLFSTSGRADWTASADDVHPYVAGEYAYLRVVKPATVWVLWNAPDRAMALVGDLPPDHIEAVLAELPRPGAENWMKRIWNRIFG
ncbi:MAG: hypothetical protein ABFS21_11060 [Actinomycetota bacterium]